jgi:hypothetical protein
MRTPLRFQSQLLPRRSYKPLRGSKRGLRIAFRPGRRFAPPVSDPCTGPTWPLRHAQGTPAPVQLPPDRWPRSG